jgi:hypothetical protein
LFFFFGEECLWWGGRQHETIGSLDGWDGWGLDEACGCRAVDECIDLHVLHQGRGLPLLVAGEVDGNWDPHLDWHRHPNLHGHLHWDLHEALHDAIHEDRLPDRKRYLPLHDHRSIHQDHPFLVDLADGWHRWSCCGGLVCLSMVLGGCTIVDGRGVFHRRWWGWERLQDRGGD